MLHFVPPCIHAWSACICSEWQFWLPPLTTRLILYLFGVCSSLSFTRPGTMWIKQTSNLLFLLSDRVTVEHALTATAQASVVVLMNKAGWYYIILYVMWLIIQRCTCVHTVMPKANMHVCAFGKMQAYHSLCLHVCRTVSLMRWSTSADSRFEDGFAPTATLLHCYETSSFEAAWYWKHQQLIFFTLLGYQGVNSWYHTTIVEPWPL